MTLTQKEQEAVRKHMQGISPASSWSQIRAFVISLRDPDLFNVLLFGGKSKPFDLYDDGTERRQISLHDRPVVVDMTLIPTEEWLRMFIPDKSIEAIILLYDTADRDGYEALKPVDGKVLGYVKIPPKVQATRSWKSMWRLAREKLQPQPQIVEPPPPPIFLVAISVPWHESTDKVTREQGEELCEILGGTFVELTGKRFPDQEYLSETTKRLFGDLVSRAILRKIKSAQLTKKG